MNAVEIFTSAFKKGYLNKIAEYIPESINTEILDTLDMARLNIESILDINKDRYKFRPLSKKRKRKVKPSLLGSIGVMHGHKHRIH